MKFFKSKAFQTLLHFLLVAGGSYLSYSQGTPLPLVITGGLNAILPSPLSSSDPKGN